MPQKHEGFMKVSDADVTIRAGAAGFGDGRHPTTAGVLAALEGIDPEQFTPRRACDMGAGSGILSFAIAARFGCPVWSVEQQRQGFETLQENIRTNGYAGRITPLQANGFAHPALAEAAPFDLIVMNILAEPLLALAADAAQALAASGVMILSGMLRWQAGTIEQAYRGLGLELSARLTLEEWVTLVVQKP